MRDDPRQNLKWLEQELLASERPAAPSGVSHDTADLLAQVDHLLEDMDAEPPAFVQKPKKRPTKGERAVRSHVSSQFDESAAVLTKTKAQLRKEARQRKAAAKKASVNRNIKGLVILAMLEIIGILCILGWWFL